MTGPEHYREAERLADRADGLEPDHAAHVLASAQVHATLALASATAIPLCDYPDNHPEVAGWIAAAGVKRSSEQDGDHP